MAALLFVSMALCVILALGAINFALWFNFGDTQFAKGAVAVCIGSGAALTLIYLIAERNLAWIELFEEMRTQKEAPQ